MEGLGTTVVGMFTVFAVLTVLCGVLYLLRFVNVEKKDKNISEKPLELPKPPVEIKEEILVEDEVDDTELVAVITATIAMMLDTSSDKLRIKSITKVKNWNSTARREQQRNTI